MSEVIQTGLYTRSERQLESFADRVSDFNKRKGFVCVEMEGRESLSDDVCPEPHWKVTLTFKSRAIAKEFWTDPVYDVKILMPHNDNS